MARCLGVLWLVCFIKLHSSIKRTIYKFIYDCIININTILHSTVSQKRVNLIELAMTPLKSSKFKFLIVLVPRKVTQRSFIDGGWWIYNLGRTNHSKSGPNKPTFFSWVWVHALMAVRTLTLSLVKYLRDAVDFCETAQLPL